MKMIKQLEDSIYKEIKEKEEPSDPVAVFRCKVLKLTLYIHGWQDAVSVKCANNNFLTSSRSW